MLADSPDAGGGEADVLGAVVDSSEGDEPDVVEEIESSRFVAATLGDTGKSFGAAKRAWHQVPDVAPSRTPEGRPRLVLETINRRDRVELSPLRDDGGFSKTDLELASYLLRDHRVERILLIDPRLLDLAYQLQLHFEANVIRVLSGYRVARRRPSNHSRGRAIDIVVPGHRDDEVAAYARTIGFVGVGFYPASGFVHLDTRNRSFFWVDWSGPGQRSRLRQVAAKQAEEADANAIARGQVPPGSEGGVDDGTEETAFEGAGKTSPAKTFNTSTAGMPPLVTGQ